MTPEAIRRIIEVERASVCIEIEANVNNRAFILVGAFQRKKIGTPYDPNSPFSYYYIHGELSSVLIDQDVSEGDFVVFKRHNYSSFEQLSQSLLERGVSLDQLRRTTETDCPI